MVTILNSHIASYAFNDKYISLQFFLLTDKDAHGMNLQEDSSANSKQLQGMKSNFFSV